MFGQFADTTPKPRNPKPIAPSIKPRRGGLFIGERQNQPPPFCFSAAQYFVMHRALETVPISNLGKPPGVHCIKPRQFIVSLPAKA
jgi:hypothetical protein